MNSSPGKLGGVPPGPYPVLTFFGPSNPREPVGLIADSATVPYPYFVVWYVSSAITATNIVNKWARYIEEIDANRRTALDFYSFQRNTYVSSRENLVHDEETDDEEPTDGLDYFEDEDDEGTAGGNGNL